jgi:hypothetical protein
VPTKRGWLAQDRPNLAPPLAIATPKDDKALQDMSPSTRHQLFQLHYVDISYQEVRET